MYNLFISYCIFQCPKNQYIVLNNGFKIMSTATVKRLKFTYNLNVCIKRASNLNKY